MNTRTRVAKNTLYLISSEIVIKTLGMFWVVFLAQSLSVTDFGKYNLTNSIVAVFAIFSDLGIGLIIVREIARNIKKSKEYIGYGLLLNSAVSVLILLTLFVFGWLGNFPQSTKILIYLAAINFFISSFRISAIYYLDATQKYKNIAVLNGFNMTALIAFGYIGIKSTENITGIYFGMITASLLSVALTWIFLTKKYITPRIGFNTKKIKELVLQGLPLGVAALSAVLYTKLDTIVLAHYLGEREVGIYSSATPFGISLVQLINVPIVVALYPPLTQLYEKSRKRFTQGVRRSLFVIALWSVPAALITSLASQTILPFIFGEKYIEAIPILRIYIFVVPFISLSALLYKVLIIAGKQKIYLYVSIFGAIVNTILNVILVPKLGLYGAAFAAVTTHALLFTLYFVIVNKIINRNFL